MEIVFARLRRRYGPNLTIVAFGAMVLAACAHPVPQMNGDRTIVIPAQKIADKDGHAVAGAFLAVAGRLTLEHGFRYFTIVSPANALSSDGQVPQIAASTNVTIRVFRAGEIDPRRPGVWDAQRVAAPS